jgi:hypothetical protein
MRATSVHYDEVSARVVVDLANRSMFAFPAELAQGLRGATAAQLANIRIMPLGDVLYWKDLDTHLSLHSLMQGVFGGREWMKAIGKVGGSATSSIKAAAARENGALGGRPRKSRS